ncbi:MAG: RhuM family protein [Planctomycetaceae bacterium]
MSALIPSPGELPPDAQILIYEDGATQLQVRLDGATVWLPQLSIAELFQTTKQSVSLHLQNIYEEGELDPAATVKQYLTVQTEGNRQVRRAIDHYNLEAILAIGYRVRSPQGTRFRQWATARLSELLVKGFSRSPRYDLSVYRFPQFQRKIASPTFSGRWTTRSS